jgi:N-terminal acetyltransferase B complex non-catalytic subunit
VRPIIRPAYQAKLYLQRNSEAQIDQVDQKSLLQTCSDYADFFSEKAFCFDDLKQSLSRLDQAHCQQFIEPMEMNESNLKRLFAMKLVYRSAQAHDTTEQQDKALLDFAYRALKLYQKSITEAQPCPEAAVLAVLAIMRIEGRESVFQKTLFAITILEITRSKFEDYYILTILLVQLQAHFGLLSLAMEYFTKLSVKNMQWETVGHLILTRISSLHPAFNGKAGDLDPLRACDTTVAVLENADNALVRGIREGLRCNAYSNIYNSVNMRSVILRSMNKHICAVEERRLARWRGSDHEDHAVLPMPSASQPLVDSRDYSYLPSYREDDQALLDRYRCGQQPKLEWLNAMALLDNVATYLKADLGAHTTLASTAYENMRKLSESFSTATTSPEDLKDEMTDVELSSFDKAQTLARAMLAIGGSASSHGKESISDLLDGLKTALKYDLDEHRSHESSPGSANIMDISIPTWIELHTSLSSFEMLQTTSLFLTWLSKKQKSSKSSKNNPLSSVTKEQISELQSLVTDLEAQIHKLARAMKAQLQEPGVLGKLVDLGMARRGGHPQSMWEALDASQDWETLMESLCDEATMETICGRYRESWDDALDGVLATKVGTGK